MKIKKGKFLLLATLLCAIAATGICAIAESDGTASSPREQSGSFYMVYGAQAKTADGENGIRFTSKISEKFYESLISDGSTVELHTLISKEPDAGEITPDTEGVINVPCRKEISFDADPSTDDEFEFKAALYDLGEYFDGFGFDTRMTARAYAKVTASGGNERIVYADSNDNTRSLRDIANSALINGETDPDGMLESYVTVGARENSVNGYITADGKAEGFIDSLPSGAYTQAYLGAKKVTATVSGGMVSFALSQADKNALNGKNNGDELGLTVFAEDGKAYSTKIRYVEKAPVLTGVAATKEQVVFGSETVDAWRVRGAKEGTVLGFGGEYINDLKESGVKAVKIYFENFNCYVKPGANLKQAPEAAYRSWADTNVTGLSDWKLFNLGGIWSKGFYGNNSESSAYRHSDTVLTPDDLSNFSVRLTTNGASVNGYMYIKTYTDDYPEVSSYVNYTTDTTAVPGYKVITVSPNLGANVGFMLSEAYIDGFEKNGKMPKKFTVMVKSDAENIFVNCGYSNNDCGLSNVNAALNYNSGYVYDPTQPAKMVQYGWYNGYSDFKPFGARLTPDQLKAAHFCQTNGSYFSLYLIPDYDGALESSDKTADSTITPTALDFDGKTVSGYNITFTAKDQRLGFTDEYINDLKERGVKAVKVWVNKQYYVKPDTSLMTDTTYDWRNGAKDWSAVNIGGRYDKSYPKFSLSDDVLIPDDLKAFDVAITSADVMSVYIEEFTDDYPVVSGKDYTEENAVLADGSTGTVYRVEFDCPAHNNGSLCDHNGGFMISAAYIADLKEQGCTSITVMVKADGTITRRLGYMSTEDNFDKWFAGMSADSWTALTNTTGSTFTIEEAYKLHICVPDNASPRANYIEFYVIGNK